MSIRNTALATTYRIRHWRPAWAKIDRHNYKASWNSISFFEHDAKIGVAGLVDETIIAQSAANTVETLKRCVGVGGGDVVLEIGAGVGRVGAALAPLCRRWIGTDVSRHMVAHMRRRLGGFGNVEIHEISGYDLQPIASGSVDVVYCTVVFMHLEEWDRFAYVAEAFRVLKPGGRLLVDNVNLLSDQGWAFFEVHRRVKPRRRAAQTSKTSTPQELECFFARAGFAAIGQEMVDRWVVTFGTKPAA